MIEGGSGGRGVQQGTAAPVPAQVLEDPGVQAEAAAAAVEEAEERGEMGVGEEEQGRGLG